MGIRVNGAEQSGSTVTAEVDSVQGTVTFEVNSDNVYAYSPTDDSDLELFMGKSPGQVGMFAGNAASTVSISHDAGAGAGEVNLSSSVVEIKTAGAKQIQILTQGTGNLTVGSSVNGTGLTVLPATEEIVLRSATGVANITVGDGNDKVGLFGATPVVKQTVTGVTVDAAVISLLAKLELMGIIVDGHT